MPAWKRVGPRHYTCEALYSAVYWHTVWREWAAECPPSERHPMGVMGMFPSLRAAKAAVLREGEMAAADEAEYQRWRAAFAALLEEDCPDEEV